MTHVRCGRLVVSVSLVLLTAACGSSSGKTTASSTTGASTTTSPSTTTTAPVTTTTVGAADSGAWSLVPNGPNPLAPPVAWSGKEILAAESACCGAVGSVNLSAYNPATSTWRKLPDAPLSRRTLSAGVWTGSEMIVAGGFASAKGNGEDLKPATDGAAWSAATNAWHAIAAMPEPLATAVPVPGPSAVWTGKEMLVWSSVPYASTPPTVAREVVLAYNPTTDKWRTLPASGLAPRIHPVTVWTGKELVVWGGLHGNYKDPYADGARLDPNTNTWRPLPAAPVPARGEAAAVWSGHEVLLWGGNDGTNSLGRGAAYNPGTNSWRALPASPLRAKTLPAGVWNGHYFFVIGGVAGTLPVPGPGTAAYDPATNKWTALPAAPPYPPAYQHGPTYAADQRVDGLGVWTGTSVVVISGLDYFRQEPLADGVQWTPTTGLHG